MKTENLRQRAKARLPYNTSKRAKKHASQVKPASVASSGASATTISHPIPPNPGNGAVLSRDICTEQMRKFYPDFQPRNDYDVAVLGTMPKQDGTTAEIFAWIDEQFKSEVEYHGSREAALRKTTAFLNTWVEPTGKKPAPGGDEAKWIFVRPIPDSQYSIRLFPGSISAAEYCMDFVDSATGEPVNSPFEYELWGVPDPETPWAMPMCGRLRSIERAHGIKQEDILPGEERFVLRDGQTCMLMRPGKKSLRFTVPVRLRKTVEEPVDVVDLPRTLGPV